MKSDAKDESVSPEVKASDTELPRNTKWSVIDIIGFILFACCWIVFTVLITIWVSDKGFNIVLAILAGIIGGFIATVVTWVLGRGGVT